ncbi:uncharacterized protein LOC123672391 isoform X2 [Harmonia axyridis]|uniref:uncharacterized protein LOC123672391 isoform X2 n=1 Tax=Harmonia axyridis TaxID=115357 RepID=UPI001E277C2B|nr:uncharacterized protein LOC123672391 isoform X2 [Harmonia axyridis]
MGLPSGQIGDRLFESDNLLTFAEAVKIAKSREAAVGKSGKSPPFPLKKEAQELFQVRSRSQVKPANQKEASGSRAVCCAVCGRKNHEAYRCQFRECLCHICGKPGHLAPMCYSKKNNNSFSNSNSNNWRNRKSGNKFKNCNNFIEKLNSEELYSMSHLKENEKVNPISVQLQILGRTFSFQLDTGAAVSAVSDIFYFEYFRNFELIKTSTILSLYTGQKFKPMGCIILPVNFGGVDSRLTIYVIENGGPPILGRNFLNAFDSLFHFSTEFFPEVVQLFDEYPELFSSGLGTFNKGKAKLLLKNPESVHPKFIKARAVPYALREGKAMELVQ